MDNFIKIANQIQFDIFMEGKVYRKSKLVWFVAV